MQKDKCLICNIGASISNDCELQHEYFKLGHEWEEDTKAFEQQISMCVAELKKRFSAHDKKTKQSVKAKA